MFSKTTSLATPSPLFSNEIVYSNSSFGLISSLFNDALTNKFGYFIFNILLLRKILPFISDLTSVIVDLTFSLIRLSNFAFT